MKGLGQGGFTLVETLVSTGIMGLVVALMSTGLFQALTATEKANAGQQVQGTTRGASVWLLRDVPMGRSTDLMDAGAPVSSAIFTWIDYFGGGALSHSVSYALANGDLVRNYDGGSFAVARGVGSVSFSRTGRLVTVTLAAAPSGRFNVTDQKSLKILMRSSP